MNKYIISLLLLFTISCSSGEDVSVDPTVIPPPTTEGLVTFGCLIDGWIYAGGRYSKPEATYFPTNGEEDEYISVKAEINSGEYISFRINHPSERETTYTGATFETRDRTIELANGVVNITRFDTHKKIISGTFEGNDVKEGRFDLLYKE